MDPLTVAIIDVLGKYAIDQGITLLKEAGQAAAQLLPLRESYRVRGVM